tara:strand:- start:1739 stop:4816 length:3078 start_codon:yes stop_codon:yes gene_type:complete
MISSDNGRRVFALEIAGLEYRYHSNKPPASSSLDSQIATGINYIDVESIVAVGSINADLDPSGGVANYGATTVTLNINRRGGASDAGVIFGRCGARSASTRAKLTTSATRTDTTISISSDLSSLSYPRLLHVGAETIRASSANATSVTCTRGAGNTPIQVHSIDLEGSIVPEITTEITTFRGRRARLYAAHRYATGETSNYIEIVNGFIESSPTVEDEEITISLLPLTALIDTDLSDKGIAQTRLLTGYHYFDGRQGSILEYALGLYKDQDDNEPVLTPDTGAAITASTFQTTVARRRSFSNLFDDFDTSLPKGPTADNYPREHPRYPKLRRSQDAVFVEDGVYPSTLTFNAGNVGYDVVADSSITSALNAAEISASESLRIRLPVVELKQHQLGNAEVKKWPDVLNDTLTTSGPSSTAGVAGGFGRWRINRDNELTFEKLSNSPFTSRLFLWNNSYLWRFVRRGLRDQGVRAPLKWGAFGTSGPLDNLSRISYPIDLGLSDDSIEQQFGEGDGWRRVEIDASSNATSSIRQIRDIPSAYYQQFESAILVETSLGLPTSSSAGVYHYVTVEFYDHKLDEIRRQVFKCTHQSAASFGGSTVGYLIHISNDHEFQNSFSFGDWSDKERALIYRGGSADGERPSVVLLQLLQSGGGGGLNGTYDQFSIGLNIHSSNIDEASFLAIDGSSTFTLSENFAGDGANLRDTFDSVLRLLGAVIVMKRDESTGVSKLTLVSLGNERASSSDLTISAGDWIADPSPTWGIYEDIVTQIKYEFDYDPAEDKYLNEVIFNNYAAINRYGGERAKITLTLAGLNSDQFGRGAGDNFAYFLPTSARLFNLLSNPLRTWRGEIGTGKSIYIDVGSYITVSSPHLRGYSDDYGVVDGVGMVRAIRQDLLNEGCEIELITTGLTAVNWNSAARVSSHTATTVTVDANKYSVSPATDASFFKAGDVVDYLPAGNHDNAITGLTIDSVVGHVITFTAAHGISTNGGTVEPTNFSSASTLHKIDAYLANSSDILGASTPAKELS